MFEEHLRVFNAVLRNRRHSVLPEKRLADFYQNVLVVENRPSETILFPFALKIRSRGDRTRFNYLRKIYIWTVMEHELATGLFRYQKPECWTPTLRFPPADHLPSTLQARCISVLFGVLCRHPGTFLREGCRHVERESPREIVRRGDGARGATFGHF